ncbi:Bet5-like_protein [Hexamita inflata]|uniref:Trafficking protein particle complex subunit n=1 Tax=Hexamita inflata TaxID=28002 RepID=A0AA86PX42_9EUKA|nr:Bet5-like protein [Hexamita inflata]CAI9928903.1 Bet5-like protein [Hexamita inflata]CAI9938709.1 Bet5-like protein [Hexamita inflata]CAI9942890.1 Bet5-like protein [Hexamita inflata]
MPIHQFYIIDKNGQIMFFKPLTQQANQEQDSFVPALLWQLKQTVTRFNNSQLNSYETTEYSCHSFETPTGYMFVALADSGYRSLQDDLKLFYQNVFVQFCLNDFDWDPALGKFGEDFVKGVQKFWDER